jgi:hypothetical protein
MATPTIAKAKLTSSKARFARRVQAFRKNRTRNILTVKLREGSKTIYLTIVSAGTGDVGKGHKPLAKDFFSPTKARGHTEGILLHILRNTTLQVDNGKGGKKTLDPSKLTVEWVYSSNEACSGTANNHEDCRNAVLPHLSKSPYNFHYSAEYGKATGQGSKFKATVSTLMTERRKWLMKTRKANKNEGGAALAKKDAVGKALRGARFGGGKPKGIPADLLSESASVATENIERNLVIADDNMNDNINRHNNELATFAKNQKHVMKAMDLQAWLDNVPTDEIMQGTSSTYLPAHVAP